MVNKVIEHQQQLNPSQKMQSQWLIRQRMRIEEILYYWKNSLGMVEDSHPIHLQTISCSTDARRFLQVRMSAVPSEQVCDWVHSRSVRNAYPTVIIPKKDRAVRWVAYRTCSASWIKWWDNNFIQCHWWQQWQIKMGNEPPASMYGVSLQERSLCFVSVTLLFWIPRRTRTSKLIHEWMGYVYSMNIVTENGTQKNCLRGTRCEMKKVRRYNYRHPLRKSLI